jgi:putative phage-type endonuclease
MVTKELLSYLPNVTVVSTVRQEDDEKEWLNVRTKGIGGSDIGAICGVSPFSSARQIYFNKTGQFQDVLKPGAAAQERMHFGHLLEPIVADEFARRTSKKLLEVDATFCHKDFPWRRANVDRLIVDDNGKPYGILECKTTSEYNNDEWEAGDILLSYVYQLNWYLHILDLEYGAFACLVGGNKFYYYEVFRNDELINDTLIPAATHFWFDNVMALKEPELQATDTELASTLYSDVEKNSEITLVDDTANELARVIVESKAKIKELEGIVEEAQNRLKDRLQEHEIGYCRDYTVKWSPRKQSRVDASLLKATFPEVYEQCKKTIEYRVMTIKGLDS